LSNVYIFITKINKSLILRVSSEKSKVEKY